MPNYADFTAPLVELTKKGARNQVEWGEDKEEAFKDVKWCLWRSPILLAPNPEKEFVLRTGASDSCLGAVLLHESEGFLHPLAYARRMLS